MQTVDEDFDIIADLYAIYAKIAELPMFIEEHRLEDYIFDIEKFDVLLKCKEKTLYLQKENEPNIKLNIKEEFEDFKNNIVFLLNQANDRSIFFWRGYRNNILDEIINIINLEIINLLSITLIEKEKNAA